MKREKEIWLPVVGYEGLYEISSYGQLKRLEGETISVREGYKDTTIYRPEKILKSAYNHKGHLHNDLHRWDSVKKVYKRKAVLIHRLVAEAFISKQPSGKPQVRHKNGIKDDNFYKNLEWCNNSQNQILARKSGIRPPNPKNWDYPHGKPVNQLELGTTRVINTFGSYMEAERVTEIPSQNIRKVIKGERGSAGGYSWELFEGENKYTKKRKEKIKKMNKRKMRKEKFFNLVTLENMKTGDVTKYVNISNPKNPMSKNIIRKYADSGDIFVPYNNTKHNNSYKVSIDKLSEKRLREMPDVIW